MFRINYQNGMIEEGFVTVEEAKAAVDFEYTQCNVTIEDEDGDEVLRSTWYSVPASDEDDVIESFGTFGFYQGWEVCD